MPTPEEQSGQPGADHDASDFDTAFDEFAGVEPADSGDYQDVPDEEPARDDLGRFVSVSEEDSAEAGSAADDGAGAIDWDSDDNPWKQKHQSISTQQAALQQQLNQMMAQQVQHSGQPTVDQQPEGGSLDSDDEWKALKEDFPEIADVLEKRLSAVEQSYRAQHEQLTQQIQPMQQQAQQQFLQSQYQALEAQHPDYQQVAASAEFKDWLGHQPATIQQMVDSTSAADAAYLLSAYKQTVPDTSANDQLKERRQRQLEQSQTISRRGGRHVQPDSGDFESMFEHFASKANP